MSLKNPLKKYKKIESPKVSEGGLAFSNDIEISENPYEIGTIDYLRWIEGWEKASGSRQTFEGKSKQSVSLDSNVYEIGFGITAIITFIGCWIYAIASWGFLLGVGMGWIPSFFIAVIVGFLWPLVGLLLFLGLLCIGFIIFKG